MEAYFIELNDVWVSHDLENMNFSRHSLDIRLIFDLVFLQNFDSDLLSCENVSAQSDLAKGSLTERPTFIKR